ncbi:hypothetical protein PTMSG1_05930 [Pyrenophora teres f. maculata]|nr:hypothetical protein PTMSG1_05930 [Pyrenophora teres f. maculata]
MSDRQGHLPFLHFPPELRNRVYDFVRKTTINWENIPGYIRTFYPMTAEGKVENIELAPSSMTIMPPDSFADTALINIAFLLIIKMGVSNPSFACKFQVDESPPLSNYHSWHDWPFWRSQKYAQFIQS